MVTKTVELPLQRIGAGRVVPVDVLDAKGNLLLRKGGSISSEQHKEQLAAHGACVRETDFKAWQRSYDRLINRMLRDGESLDAMAKAPMPSKIEDSDYAIGFEIQGGWLDVHEVHKALLYQGAEAKSPLNRIESVHSRAAELLRADVDAALFALFQALLTCRCPTVQNTPCWRRFCVNSRRKSCNCPSCCARCFFAQPC